MRTIVGICLWLISLNANSQQNLVQNGNMETEAGCLNGPYDQVNSGCVPGWSGSSTEYFSASNGFDCDGTFAPNNPTNATNPIPGTNRCAGVAFLGHSTGGTSFASAHQMRNDILNGEGFKEGIYGTLSSPLIAGIRYQASFQTFLQTNNWSGWGPFRSEIAIGKMELGFTTGQPVTQQGQNWVGSGNNNSYQNYWTAIAGSPNNPIITGPSWLTLSNSYLAHGGEQHFAISYGNPNNALPLDTNDVVFSGAYATDAQTTGFTAYYLLDNVAVSCQPQIQYEIQSGVATGNTNQIVLNPVPGSGNARGVRFKVGIYQMNGQLISETPFQSSWTSVTTPYQTAQLPQNLDLHQLFPGFQFQSCSPYKIKVTTESFCHSNTDTVTTETPFFNLSTMACFSSQLSQSQIQCGSNPTLNLQNDGLTPGQVEVSLLDGGSNIIGTATLPIASQTVIHPSLSTIFQSQPLRIHAGNNYHLKTQFTNQAGLTLIQNHPMQFSNPFCGRLQIQNQASSCDSPATIYLKNLTTVSHYQLIGNSGSTAVIPTLGAPQVNISAASIFNQVGAGSQNLTVNFSSAPSPFYESFTEPLVIPNAICGNLIVKPSTICSESIPVRFENGLFETIQGQWVLSKISDTNQVETTLSTSPTFSIPAKGQPGAKIQTTAQQLFPNIDWVQTDAQYRIELKAHFAPLNLNHDFQKTFRIESIPTKIEIGSHATYDYSKQSWIAASDTPIRFGIHSSKTAAISTALWKFPHPTEPFGHELTEVREWQESIPEPGKSVELEVHYISGCISKTKTNLILRQERFFAPNSFTPNGDGLNDIFEFTGQDFEVAEMRVYDRWGQVQFEARGRSNARWDGRTPSGAPAPNGVYTVQAAIRLMNGAESTHSHLLPSQVTQALHLIR